MPATAVVQDEPVVERGPALTPVAALVQAALVVVLTLLALFTFDRSFSDRSYLVVGGIAAVVPTMMAVLLHLAGMKVGRFSIFVYVLFLPLAAACVFRSTTPSAVVDVMRATVDAPRILLTTIPPADADGAVLVLPFTLAYVAAASAAWLALNSRKPVVPLLPLVGALALCVLFGTEETRSVLVKSAVFVGVALWWVALRSASAPEVAHARRGAVVRAVGSAALVGLVVLLVTALVGDAANRLVLRGILGTGYDVSSADNPLADFREYTSDTGDGAIYGRRLLTVRGLPKKEPMRFVVLDTYDGEEWDAGNDTVDDTREDRFQQLGSEVGTTAEGREVEVRVRVSPLWTSEWLPLAGQLTGLTFDGPLARSPQDDVRFNPATGTGLVIGGLTEDDGYSFTAVLPDSELPDNAAPYDNEGDLQPEGAFLDEYLEPWREVGVTAVDRVLLLAEYLKANGIYSDGAAIGDTDVPRGHSRERLARFAYEPVGNGEQYAAFVALAANRLGVPARVVVGAHAGEKGVIRGKDVEAWVELRIADGSWRVLPTDSFQGSNQEQRQRPQQSAQDFVDEEKRQQERDQDRADADSSAQQGDDGGVPWGRILLGLLLAALVGVVPGLKELRRRQRRGRGGAEAVVGAWRELLDDAADLGVPVPSGAPRPAQAAGLTTSERGPGEQQRGEVVGLAERADDLLFARDAPSADDVRAYWDDVATARARWHAQLPWSRRALARWRVNSLRRSLARALSGRASRR